MILVTGANGQVGRALIRKLLREGRPVVALDRSPEAARALGPFGISVLVGGVRERGILWEACREVEQVVHLVGGLRESREEPYEVVDCLGMQNLVSAAQAAEVKKIIYLSYPGADPLAENRLLRARGQAEEILRTSGISYTILRSSLIYSRGCRLLERLKVVVRRGWGFILGAGDQYLQPIQVNDGVRFILEALWNPKSRDRTLEIGGPGQIRYREFLELIAQILGSRFHPIPLPLYLVKAVLPLSRPLAGRRRLTRELVEFLTRDMLADLDRTFAILETRLTLTPLTEGLRKALT